MGGPTSTGTGDHRRVISYDEVVAGARAHFEREGTIVMDALATELGISRSTLYRVIEGRDQLLGDVIWQMAAPILQAGCRRATGGGIDAILQVSLDFYDTIHNAGAFRRFLAQEPQTAVRVLFTPVGRVHERAARAQRAIFVAASQGTDLRLADDLDGLAYLYVRIVESLLYGDLLSGRRPDLKLVERAARAVLTAPDPAADPG